MIKKRSQLVTQAEWDFVHDQGEAAKELLENERFKFAIDWLTTRKSSIVEAFVTNKIKSVDENIVYQTITGIVNKIFHTTKEEQYTEMSGQYQLADEFIEMLKTAVSTMEMYDKEFELGKIKIKPEDKL